MIDSSLPHFHTRIEVQMSFQDQQQCSSCNDARQELETMATTLDKGGTGKHRELILENLALRRKVRLTVLYRFLVSVNLHLIGCTCIHIHII